MPLPLQILLWVLIAAASLVASAHAIIYKREPRAATLWAMAAWLLPVIGPALYYLLGINRVRREAAALRRGMVRHRTSSDCDGEGTDLEIEAAHLQSLARLNCRVSDRQLVSGNRIEALVDGEQAFPAMLQAIDEAKVSVAFSTYIFDSGGIGEKFIDALERAHKRGVEVRALIDSVGARYCRPRVYPILRQRGVPAALFNPPLLYPWITAFNLRNHRKILIADGAVGFTGGINVKREYWNDGDSSKCFRDLHFRVLGPVVAHLMEVFVNDWQFTTGEALRGEKWFPKLSAFEGGGLARGIEAGPDESYDRTRWVLIGALNAARKSVRIATPYFVPDTGILSALNAAALRGVQVDILIPRESNLPYVHWAMFGHLWQALERGCRVWLSSGAFDHSKLMIVDSAWTLIGSANWDARSLRLNFEFSVESFDPEFAFKMDQLFDERLATAREVTLQEVDARPFLIKFRDGFARLFAPYI